MSFFGTTMDFEEGARLTGIDLRPLLDEIPRSSGVVTLQVVRTPDGIAADPVGRATAAFLGAALGVLLGTEADGSEWFVVFQYGTAERDADEGIDAANFALWRALDLVGLDEVDVWTWLFSTDDLRRAYRGQGLQGVEQWSLSELLTGLVVELATAANMDSVVTRANEAGTRGQGGRQRVLHEALHDWSATYEG